MTSTGELAMKEKYIIYANINSQDFGMCMGVFKCVCGVCVNERLCVCVSVCLCFLCQQFHGLFWLPMFYLEL